MISKECRNVMMYLLLIKSIHVCNKKWIVRVIDAYDAIYHLWIIFTQYFTKIYRLINRDSAKSSISFDKEIENKYLRGIYLYHKEN